MAVQSSITEYFNSRKRPAVDDVKKIGQPSKKVMILENIKGDVSGCPELNASREESSGKSQSSARRKLIYLDKRSETRGLKNGTKSVNKNKKDFLDKFLVKNNSYVGKQEDIRKTFSVISRPPTVINKVESPGSEVKSNEEIQIAADNYSTPKKSITPYMERSFSKKVEESPELPGKDLHTHTVPEAVLHCSPKKEAHDLSEEEANTHICPHNEIKDAVKDSRPTENIITKEVTGGDSAQKIESKKELNLEEIKSKLKKSSRRNELKAALGRLNDGFSKLNKLREKSITSDKPSLKKFDTVTFEVVTSPSKTPVKISSGMSPAKLREAVFKSPGRTVNMEPVYISPRKLFDVQPEPNPLLSPTKPPAFQRYQALISEGRSALTLPFKYRSLAEIFRGIETVVSMMHNRGETVTFTKLKSAVQELLRRNLYEKHLGQIKTVFNDAFEIAYEKTPSAGKHQPDKYELVIKPILKKSSTKTTEDTSSSETNVTKLEMTPDVLLERRRGFYNSLLDKTKFYHEEFLLSLDPPIHVSRDSITRWHPEFDVDDVPDIDVSSLPEPPNVQKVASAKDVLERARNLFGTNPRLDSAMQRLSEQNSETDTQNVSTYTTNTGPAVAALTNALKGIPKSLLEKVRAKQAAKALEAMTRSPSQAKEAVRLTRLPEIARIVRNIFISEKKSVLTRELVIKKLSDSYRENLSFSELDIHLDLLQEKTPGWLSFCTLRKTNFVKFVKDADMSRIMARLESIASENNY